jgi:toxin ParE1/3/4
MQTKWTKRAANNLDTILTYIASNNPIAAQDFARDIRAQMAKLEHFPLMGRSGMVPSTRELVVHENYIVYYRVREDNIEILRVLHARRRYP